MQQRHTFILRLGGFYSFSLLYFEFIFEKKAKVEEGVM